VRARLRGGPIARESDLPRSNRPINESPPAVGRSSSSRIGPRRRLQLIAIPGIVRWTAALSVNASGCFPHHRGLRPDSSARAASSIRRRETGAEQPRHIPNCSLVFHTIVAPQVIGSSTIRDDFGVRRYGTMARTRRRPSRCWDRPNRSPAATTRLGSLVGSGPEMIVRTATGFAFGPCHSAPAAGRTRAGVP